jgi:intracellular multiplication protein IcmO
MSLDLKKYGYGKKTIVRDIRPLYQRFGEWLQRPANALSICIIGLSSFFVIPETILFGDIIFILYLLFFWWLKTRSRALPGKLPLGAPFKDTNNMTPGKNGTPEGILFIGNERKTKEQVWYTNSDARTHILYLGTTGSGKTEGLKSFACSALSWGSGFVYIDGKADTDLWSSLSSLVRRYGRDDDLLVLNYMTGNSDERAPSNTLNPFSSGSASYLTQMLVSLMPEAEGDNAMWKERAVSLMSSLMPALTYKRDKQDFPLSVTTIRNYLNLNYIIQMSRDESIPEKIREGLKGYLDTLPGYVDEAFDDDGKEKPMGPDQPMVDTTTVRQQHGYLTMQFTRALQSLGDDYGYIFDAKDADVDMVDIVLNRRILITLIPALEKSGDETANLGKIVAATIKGMMGSTLGSSLEGESTTVIENKPTHSETPFMTIFDEVGYYTAQGMAVMAAQARSLGFCLVFAAQDLQAMEKRVKEEARSITANCNIKVFGKLQDPTQTREYFENQIGNTYIAKVSSLQLSGGKSTGSYTDTMQAQIDKGTRADYDDLKEMKEGEAIISFAMDVIDVNVFYANPGHAKAMRVTRYLALPEPDETFVKHSNEVTKLRDLLCSKDWTAMKADVAMDTPEEIEALKTGFDLGEKHYEDAIDHGITALSELHARQHPMEAQEAARNAGTSKQSPAEPAAIPPQTTPAPEVSQTDDATPPADDYVPEQTKQPVSWDTLAEESKQEEAPPPSPPVANIKKKLSADVEKILKDAGTDMRKSLFKSGGKDDSIDAAE